MLNAAKHSWKAKIHILFFIMKDVSPVQSQRKFLRLKHLIILKYFYTESTFPKNRKTLSLLLEMTLLLYV